MTALSEPLTLEVTMALAFCPDDRPPRIIRFTKLPGNTLAELDEENNLLLVDRAKYTELSKDLQEQVLRTRNSLSIFHRA